MKTIKQNIILVALLLVIAACTQTKQKPTLFLVGDSTMADKPDLEYPERGWGQLLPTFFDTSKIEIQNHAKNGRSTRSFIYESRWDTVLSRMKAGDFVVIQFAHNDDIITKSKTYSTPTEFRYNFIKYVKETLEKGATPILCTPIVRRNFIDSMLVETHGEYPDIIRDVAKQFNVPLIDLHLESKNLLTQLGEEASKPIYLQIPPGVYKKAPNGKIDNTHFSAFGATTWSKIFTEDIKKQNLELANYLLDKEE